MRGVERKGKGKLELEERREDERKRGRPVFTERDEI